MTNRVETGAVSVRPLEPARDAASVRALHEQAADYVLLETGLAPDGSTVDAFFADCAPGTDLATTAKLGLFLSDGRLAGIADMSFGYPEAEDAYLGLMLLDRACRGRGLGAALLAHVRGVARERGAARLLIAVLDENPRGRAFWEREGFRLERSFPPSTMGRKTHVRHRMVLGL